MKPRLMYYICFFTFFLISWGLLSLLFKDLSEPIKGMISAVIAGVLSPNIKVVEAQSGKKYQFKWIFLKEVKTY